MQGTLLQALASLIFVIGLIGLMAWGLRRIESSKLAREFKQGRRMQVVEQLYLDPRHKIVLVRRDDTEHMLVLGPNPARVIESFAAGRDEVVHVA